METHWAWWVAAMVLVIAEMLTGTFYLLAVASGLAAAGLVAYLACNMGHASGGGGIVMFGERGGDFSLEAAARQTS